MKKLYTVRYSEQSKTTKAVKMSLVAKGVVQGMNRWRTENVQGSAIILYTVMMDACDYTFIQSHRMCNANTES